MKTGERAEEAAGLFSALIFTLRAVQALGEQEPPWLSIDLSMAQLKAVLLLTRENGLTARGLAERLKVGPSAVTPLVDKLVEQGLVRREEDPEDRRVSWIRPTQEAQRLYELLMSANQAMLLEVFSTLSPEELETALQGLQVISSAARRRLQQLQDAPATKKPAAEKDKEDR